MAKPKVAVELYTLRRVVEQEGLETALRQIADAGYEGVESGDLLASGEVEDVRGLFDRLGLRCAGVHLGYEQVADPDSPLQFLEEMGSKYFIVSGVGNFKTKGMRAFEEAADLFNKAARAFASMGVVFCYHNHSFEFEEFDGVRGIDRLYELTDPKLVKLCLDTYWVRHGEDDPVAFVRKHLARIALVHFKDYRDGEFAEVGEGEIDFAALLKELAKIDLEWITVEQDETTRPPSESIALSRRNLRERFEV